MADQPLAQQYTFPELIAALHAHLLALHKFGSDDLLSMAAHRAKQDGEYAQQMEHVLFYRSTIELRELLSPFGDYLARGSEVMPCYPFADAVNGIDSGIHHLRLGCAEEMEAERRVMDGYAMPDTDKSTVSEPVGVQEFDEDVWFTRFSYSRAAWKLGLIAPIDEGARAYFEDLGEGTAFDQQVLVYAFHNPLTHERYGRAFIEVNRDAQGIRYDLVMGNEQASARDDQELEALERRLFRWCCDEWLSQQGGLLIEDAEPSKGNRLSSPGT